MALVWRDQLSIGNATIDADHKMLISIINEVESALAEMNTEKLTDTLDKLEKYALKHFDTEERIAKEVGFTRVEALHAAHQDLLKELERIKKEVHRLHEEWSDGTVAFYTNFLRHWLLDHVIQEDMKMKALFISPH